MLSCQCVHVGCGVVLALLIVKLLSKMGGVLLGATCKALCLKKPAAMVLCSFYIALTLHQHSHCST